MAIKNLCAKTRTKDNPYEVWEGNYNAGMSGWRWLVLKKWQVDDSKPYARWFCFVTSPFCPDGEYGDTYVTDITQHAHCVQVEQVGIVG
jgi:hypothetical protein